MGRTKDDRLRRGEVALTNAKLAVDEMRAQEMPLVACVDSVLPHLLEVLDSLLWAHRVPCEDCGIHHPLGVDHKEWQGALNLAHAVFQNATGEAREREQETQILLDRLKEAGEFDAVGGITPTLKETALDDTGTDVEIPNLTSFVGGE